MRRESRAASCSVRLAAATPAGRRGEAARLYDAIVLVVLLLSGGVYVRR